VPHAPRDLSPGLHHVWVNATGNWAYFLDDVDRMAWIRRLVRILESRDWTCVAFCQLTTHYHMIVSVPDWSLAAGMQYLNREYSKDFNARHGRYGQLVRRRYGSRRIVDGKDLVGTYVYVVLNPVEAGLSARAEDWRWSSYATALGLTRDFEFVDASLVLAEVGGSTGKLRQLVAAEHERRLSARAMAGI
jgi:REP element-mobilizing transposase RayT